MRSDQPPRLQWHRATLPEGLRPSPTAPIPSHPATNLSITRQILTITRLRRGSDLRLYYRYDNSYLFARRGVSSCRTACGSNASVTEPTLRPALFMVLDTTNAHLATRGVSVAYTDRRSYAANDRARHSNPIEASTRVTAYFDNEVITP